MSLADDSQRFQRAVSRLRGRPRRLVDYLAKRPGGAMTSEIARECACQNVSDAAAKACRALEPAGYTIENALPQPPTRNRYGEVSQQHRWRLTRLH